MFVVSSSSKLGSREGDWATESTEKLDTSQLLDRVCLGLGPDMFIDDLTQKGFALFGILWCLLGRLTCFPDRIGLNRKTWFEDEDDTRFKLISIVCFVSEVCCFVFVCAKDTGWSKQVMGLFLEALQNAVVSTTNYVFVTCTILLLSCCFRSSNLKTSNSRVKRSRSSHYNLEAWLLCFIKMFGGLD